MAVKHRVLLTAAAGLACLPYSTIGRNASELAGAAWERGASSETEQSNPRPVRIVSLALVTDEIASGLVDPARILAMSRFASDEATSNVAQIAKKVNRFVDRDVEQVVHLSPDIVLSTRYAKFDSKDVIRGIGIPYHELTQFETVADIESNIRSIALALRETRRGQEMIAEMRRKLESASRQLPEERRAWSAIYLAPGEWTAGEKTIFDEIIRHSGLHNAASEAGLKGNVRISVETIIAIDPDVIIVGTGYSRDSDYAAFLANDSRFATLRGVRMKRIVALPSRHILTTSQFIGDAAMDLSQRVRALPK